MAASLLQSMQPVKDHYYSQHAVALRAELGAAISREQMRAAAPEVRRPAPGRSQLGSLRSSALATWGLIRFENPLIWIPLALVQGFTIFNFTVLLHEVVHHTVFERRHPVAERLLGFLYAMPSGISASQFTRWHLDHHAELGSDEDDPKRAHLSPKKNARWYKLLYCTPALFPIYFRAARRESATYPAELQRTIACERKAVDGRSTSSALALLWYFFGFYAAAAHQHHPGVLRLPDRLHAQPARASTTTSIPTDPAKWGTLMRGSWFWDFAFLNSNYHLEHHYFPGRAVLPPARAAARAAAVLRTEADALADLRRARLRLARREPQAAHRLESDVDQHAKDAARSSSCQRPAAASTRLPAPTPIAIHPQPQSACDPTQICRYSPADAGEDSRSRPGRAAQGGAAGPHASAARARQVRRRARAPGGARAIDRPARRAVPARHRRRVQRRQERVHQRAGRQPRSRRKG